MGSLAVLAKAVGHHVTGCDANVYPPMSTQLEAQGIELYQGYDEASLSPRPDLVIVGNAMSRGKPVVEAMLDQGIPYVSGPEWLGKSLLQSQHVLAVSGTHGKTTTASMLTWVLEHAGLEPGYLIGGIPLNFDVSARIGAGKYFVIEADEYDTAFFDKRSKFVHYHPNTLVINNLEFDHADIFNSIEDIQRQFHHIMRILPRCGRVLTQANESLVDEVIAQGLWSGQETTGENGDWRATLNVPDARSFDVYYHNEYQGSVNWQNMGQHNVNNALMVIAAAAHIGVSAQKSIAALCEFGGVKRRMEHLGEVDGVHVYDDFAHHPSAIETTLAGLRSRVGKDKIIAVLEPRSNTMKMGVHNQTLAASTQQADSIAWYLDTDNPLRNHLPEQHLMSDSIDQLVDQVVAQAMANSHIVVMSNGGFGGIHDRILNALKARNEP